MVARSNRETFLELYTQELRRRVEDEPSEYTYGVESVPQVAELMVAALAVGTGSKHSSAIRCVCARLKVSYTYEGIRGFLNAGD